jgi:hypothetical protein
MVYQRASKYEARRGKKQLKKIEAPTARITATDIEVPAVLNSRGRVIKPDRYCKLSCGEY